MKVNWSINVKNEQWKFCRSKKYNWGMTEVFLCQSWAKHYGLLTLWWFRWNACGRFIQDSRVEGFNFEEVASGDMAEKITKVDLNKMGTQPETGWELVSDWEDHPGLKRGQDTAGSEMMLDRFYIISGKQRLVWQLRWKAVLAKMRGESCFLFPLCHRTMNRIPFVIHWEGSKRLNNGKVFILSHRLWWLLTHS